ncbi:MAG: rhomboid family intramembrane serine protease [Bdellovibrionaceae bacterium]|nr:rhomboid family intramembrane serine protease [Pseudobdellovibrionaceae bacterium]
MILPFLRGLLPPHLAPVTWFLIGINLFVFIVNLPAHLATKSVLDVYVQDEEFMRTQGAVFAQLVRERPDRYSEFIRQLARNALQGDDLSKQLMGGYAARDRLFTESVDTMKFSGDAVALAKWKAEYYDFRDVQAKMPSYKWGLSRGRNGWTNWITYQFAHTGFEHIFWNLAFLLIFGACLEQLVGSSLVTLTYLGAGLAGAATFVLTAGLSYSPLVGASGSLSGLIACVAVFLWKQPARFLYWFLPVQGYWGIREFPAWLMFPVYFVPDLAGHISLIPGVGGVAYSAHLGGALFGLAVGYAIKRGWLVKEEPPAPLEESW